MRVEGTGANGRISESDMKRMFLATTIALGLAFTGSGVASATPTTQKCIEAKQSLINLQRYADTVPPDRRAGLNLMIANGQAAVAKQCK